MSAPDLDALYAQALDLATSTTASGAASVSSRSRTRPVFYSRARRFPPTLTRTPRSQRWCSANTRAASPARPSRPGDEPAEVYS